MDSPFARAASVLIARGYSPLPIAPAGDDDWSPGGKEPGAIDVRNGEPVWRRLKKWQVFCERQAHPKIIAHWASWPDAGIGIATGFGNLIAVDVDDDSLIDPILAVLPPVVVAKRGRKGLTYFGRAAEPLPSKNYRTADKRGLLDFLSSGKQTVLPPTVHPDIGRPYEWTTERTLLDTPLAELPVITGVHVAAMEEVLRRFGWDAPERPAPHGEAIERPTRRRGAVASDGAFDAAVIAARPQWLRHPALGLQRLRRVSGGWRAVASFRASGSGRALGKRGLSLSIRDAGPIKDHGGRGYNDATLVAECLFGGDVAPAFAWLREQIGWTDAPTPAVQIEPTYPDRRVGLAEAEATLGDLAGEGFGKAVLQERAVRNLRWLDRPLIQPTPPVSVIRVETGIGKTRAAIENTAAQARRGARIVYVVPYHDLADDVAAQFAKYSVRAEVYRGYDRPDPRALGFAMCRNLPAYEAARDLGVSIREAVCERRVDDAVIRCKFAGVCGRERQREAKPDVWVVPAALLPLARPDFVFDGPAEGNYGGTPIDAIVIDEQFHNNALGEPKVIDVAALVDSKIEGCDDEEADALTSIRCRLRDAVKKNGDGPLSRAVLDDHGIFITGALRASYLEQRRVTSRLLRPDMREGELRTVAYQHGAKNRLARDAGTMWEQLALFLALDHPRSGRLTVSGSKITVRPLRDVHPSWHAPTLILDATAPPPLVLTTALFGDTIGPPPSVETVDIAARWPDHVHVRQIMSAPITMRKLGLWDGPRPRNVGDVVWFIKFRASLVYPEQIGVITYKGVLEQIAGQLPPNVTVLHFGALSGSNVMENVAGLIVIGRPTPRRADVETAASVFAGCPVGGDKHQFEKVEGGIRLVGGGAVAVVAAGHPEPMAEALRWQITEGALLQAVGRLRPHRRGKPCWLDIVCDVPLPIVVHEAVQWADVDPGAVADMAAVGVILSNYRDTMTAFGFPERDARGCGHFCNKNPITKVSATSPVRRFTYRKAGPGQKPNAGHYLPAILPGGVPALRAWLEVEAKLGPLAALEVERVKFRANFAKIGREAAGSLKFENDFSSTLAVINTFFDDLEPST